MGTHGYQNEDLQSNRRDFSKLETISSYDNDFIAGYKSLKLSEIYHHDVQTSDKKKLSFVKSKAPELKANADLFSMNLAYRQQKGSSEIYPDPWNFDTVKALARMSYNAYLDIVNNSTEWLPVPGFEEDISYGHGSNGVRGYIYASDDKSLVVVSVKGTSATAFGVGGGESSKRDKLEDNLLFSCCCAAVDRSWWPVCGCSIKAGLCNSTCLAETLDMPDSYVSIVMKIRDSVTSLYPEASIWFTGHSLGGAVASLTAYATNSPAVTFEAPGEMKYAKIRRLDKIRETYSKGRKNADDALLPIWHFGVATDPIFTGQCNGVYSPCYLGGYAMETKCHMGNLCLLDIPEEEPGQGKTDIRNHRISYILRELEKIKNFLPSCYKESETCTDCKGWTYIS
jgi:lipase ATG15